MRQVIGVVEFDQCCIIDRLPVPLQQQPVNMHGYVAPAIEAHHDRDGVRGVVECCGADVQRLLEDRPATGFEYCAYGLAGEDLTVLGIDHCVRLVDEPHDRIGAAGALAVFAAV